ncbi:auxin-responsive protein IAA33 isoform X2 [Rosa rugosa]|uniref:auxin-responsive protein IAA33 isoform X2 n=1 Tax=Rosa rugosa TaxID=74645 RepID=UPI002B415584|nr:auxin-responsive protein IAA33 isoform X2 [Rosa rugosa]
MNSFQSQRLESQDSLKRRWQEIRRSSATTQPSSDMIRKPNGALNGFPGLLGDDDLVSTLVPPVTVVLEGRSICQRISLQKHTSYQSLAKALRQMFVDGGDVGATAADIDKISYALPREFEYFLPRQTQGGEGEGAHR